MELHDFGDGAGEVQAHRHLNPDGSLGFWIPDDWNVEPDMYVEYVVAKAHFQQRFDNEFMHIYVKRNLDEICEASRYEMGSLEKM